MAAASIPSSAVLDSGALYAVVSEIVQAPKADGMLEKLVESASN